MRIKRIAVYLLIAAMAFGTVSCKKSDTKSENAGQEQRANGVEAVSDTDKKEEDKEPANGQVTEENFRSFPVTDESIFGFDVVEGGLEVGGCKRDVADKVIVVPEMVSGKKVVSVGFGAFTELENVEAIVLPDSIERIGESAFTNCDNLKFVYLGKGLKSTGNMTFNMCKAIKKIELPEGMTSMNGIFVFNCPSLEVITVPATVKDVGDGIVSSKDFNGVIRTPAGSAAEKYALEHIIKVENY